MLRKALALAALVAAVSAPPARADIVISFSNTGAQSTPFTVIQGQTLTLPVFIVERANAPSSGGILAAQGLVGAGARVNYSTVPGSSTVTAATVNPGFQIPVSGFPVVNNAAGTAAFSAGALTPVTTTGTPPAIQIGTYTIQAGTLGNITTFTTA